MGAHAEATTLSICSNAVAVAPPVSANTCTNRCSCIAMLQHQTCCQGIAELTGAGVQLDTKLDASRLHLGDSCCKSRLAVVNMPYSTDVQVLFGSGVDVVCWCHKASVPECHSQAVLTRCAESASIAEQVMLTLCHLCRTVSGS